jgi:hypothetical protein
LREPLNKFPKRPVGPEHTRKVLAECQAMLQKPRLSPEMRQGLEQRIAQLKSELEAELGSRARTAKPDHEDEADYPRRGPRK